jgi:hypothetical protein
VSGHLLRVIATAVKLPLATIDKKSVDCESRRDSFASDSRVQGDGGGDGGGLLGR